MSLPKKKKIIYMASLVATVILVFSLFRMLTIEYAEMKADKLFSQAEALARDNGSLNEENVIFSLTKIIHDRFEHVNVSESFFLRIRPYLSHEILPSFISLPHGTVELLLEQGECDNAARMMGYVLNKNNISSVQFNMLNGSSAHSALLVEPNQNGFLVDPFYGVVTKPDHEGNVLLSPYEIKGKMSGKTSANTYFNLVSDSGKIDFYESFNEAIMSSAGEEMVIDVSLPELDDNRILKIGEINSDSNDVRGGARKLGMSPYWDYMGHKYNREWVRIISARENVSLTFVLTVEVDDKILISNKPPIVDGRKMMWDLSKGERLIFRDGKAERSFTRMSSYIPVDQIVIEKR